MLLIAREAVGHVDLGAERVPKRGYGDDGTKEEMSLFVKCMDIELICQSLTGQ